MSVAITLRDNRDEYLGISGEIGTVLGVLGFLGEEWKLTSVSYNRSFPEDPAEQEGMEEFMKVVEARKAMEEDDDDQEAGGLSTDGISDEVYGPATND